MTKKHEGAPEFSSLYIDSDILTYEIPFGAEYKDDEGNRQVRDFEFVIDSLKRWEKFIKKRLGCKNLVYYLTGEGNFRNEIAVSRPYKDGRPRKPFHHKATRDWLVCNYKAEVIEGMEADDMLSYMVEKDLREGKESCIVSRDKDLKMTRGWYYSWPVGKQPEKLQQGGEGWLTKEGKKVEGGGIHWFYYQLLIGDPVDTIPCLPKVGPVTAFNLLKDCTTEEELFHVVRNEYHERGYDDAYMLEQGRLLWMTTEMKDGKSVLWELPYE